MIRATRVLLDYVVKVGKTVGDKDIDDNVLMAEEEGY